MRSIQEFLTSFSKEEFSKNYMLQLAVLKLLENIGEAANKLSTSLRQKFTNIDWEVMVKARNVFVHQYFALDMNIVF